MIRREAFQILGIEPTEDKKIIKKAYAKLVKQYHPEEQPVEWQKVRDAYEIALGGIPTSVCVESLLNTNVGAQNIEKKGKLLTDEDAEQEEFLKIFDNLSDLSIQEKAQQEAEEKRQKEADKPALTAAIYEVALLRYKRFQSTKAWKRIFENEEYERVLCKEEFLAECRRSLYYAVISKRLYRYLNKHMNRIRQYNQNTQIGSINEELEAVCVQVENDIEDAYIRNKIKRTIRANLGKILFVGAIIFLLVYGTCEGQRQKAEKARAEEISRQIMEENMREIENRLPDKKENNREKELLEMYETERKWREAIEKQKENN